ncbi:MAG: hypothetical protein CUN55_00850 [Phototrophicales bacterium]|nr:MAG: hypothetical protein CUN55_00850 [Phototrophicales bacterium]
MSKQKPTVVTDVTQPMHGTSANSPISYARGPRLGSVIGIMFIFALGAVVMLGIGYLIGHSVAEGEKSDDAPIIVQPPNGSIPRQTEVAQFIDLSTQNALLTEQVAIAQRNLATADARLQTIAPLWESAVPTLTALSVPNTPIPPTSTPIITITPDANTPIQGLLPGESTITDTTNDYRFRVRISPFLNTPELSSSCGRIEGTITPSLLNGNEDFRIEWRHSDRPNATSILTRGGTDGPGRFSINVEAELLNGVFLIQLYDSNNNPVAPLITTRFPTECAGYRLLVTYTEDAG